MSFWSKIKHAFAVDPPQPIDAEDEQLLARIAAKIVGRQMTAPAILALESVRPLGFLGSQVMIALEPFVGLMVNSEDYDRLCRIMARREGVELLLEKIEQQDSKGSSKDKDES